MSWFKRKKLPAPELVEPTISLMGKRKGGNTEPTLGDVIDVTDVKEVVEPVVQTAFTVEAETVNTSSEPAVEAQSGAVSEEAAPLVEPETNVSAAAEPTREDLPAPVSLDKAEAAPDVAQNISADKPAGRFASLKERMASKSPKKGEKKAKVEEAATIEEGVSVAAAEEAAVEMSVAAPADKPKKGKATRASRSKDKTKFSAVPVRVVIGFLPEVTERDALEYAVGIAEKHFEQVGMSYFDAFKYGNGYAFEAHEGGSGKAYLPEVIRYFNSHGAFRPGEDVKAVIRTATRSVEIQRTRDGMVAVILPERDDTPTSDWLEPSSSMQPAINKRTGFLVVGAALFTTGFMAMTITSMLTRYQEYDPAPEPVRQRIESNQLPGEQWNRIQSVPSGSFVKALRYRNGKWENPEIVTLSGVGAAPAAVPGPAASAPGTAPIPDAVVPAPAAPSALPPQAPVAGAVPPSPAVPAASVNGAVAR